MNQKILAIFIQIFASSRGYTMHDLCYFWSGPGYIGDPADCQKWGYCQDNHLVAQGLCSSGQLYNSQDGTCRLAIEVNCSPNQEEICLHRQLSDYVADVKNCSIYRKCQDDETRHFLCQKGELFNNQLQRCVSGQDNRCPQAIDLCTKMQNGSLLRDPMDCTNYWLCANGIAHQMRCSAGRYFNPQTTHCQSTPPKHCLNFHDDSIVSISQPPPPVTDAHVCLKYYQIDRLSGPQFFTDSLTCYGFYVCKSQFDIGQWQKCPMGLHFQWWSQKCAPAETYSCPFDRCANLDKSMVSIISTGCKEYTLCSYDKSVHIEKCPINYPYFDETMGYCVMDFPNYKVCFMDG